MAKEKQQVQSPEPEKVKSEIVTPSEVESTPKMANSVADKISELVIPDEAGSETSNEVVAAPIIIPEVSEIENSEIVTEEDIKKQLKETPTRKMSVKEFLQTRKGVANSKSYTAKDVLRSRGGGSLVDPLEVLRNRKINK